MDYELFQVSAVKAFGHCRDVKAMVSDMQQVLSAVPGMVRKNERLEKEKADLKQENAALKVELDDWKGNAEGFEPDAYMRLPVDADGVPIRSFMPLLRRCGRGAAWWNLKSDFLNATATWRSPNSMR